MGETEQEEADKAEGPREAAGWTAKPWPHHSLSLCLPTLTQGSRDGPCAQVSWSRAEEGRM